MQRFSQITFSIPTQFAGLTKYYKVFAYMGDRHQVWLHNFWSHVDQLLLASGQVLTASPAPCIALVEIIFKDANGLTYKAIL